MFTPDSHCYDANFPRLGPLTESDVADRAMIAALMEVRSPLAILRSAAIALIGAGLAKLAGAFDYAALAFAYPHADAPDGEHWLVPPLF